MHTRRVAFAAFLSLALASQASEYCNDELTAGKLAPPGTSSSLGHVAYYAGDLACNFVVIIEFWEEGTHTVEVRQGAAGENGGLLLSFPLQGPRKWLTPEELCALPEGPLYVLVTNEAFPGGEVCAQICREAPFPCAECFLEEGEVEGECLAIPEIQGSLGFDTPFAGEPWCENMGCAPWEFHAGGNFVHHLPAAASRKGTWCVYQDAGQEYLRLTTTESCVRDPEEEGECEGAGACPPTFCVPASEVQDFALVREDACTITAGYNLDGSRPGSLQDADLLIDIEPLNPACGEGEGEGEGEEPAVLGYDRDGDHRISLSELLRIIQFYNSPGIHCEAGTEDGFAPGPGDTSCPPYAADYQPQNWIISLSELLRAIQLYNADGYTHCPAEGTEDGFCPGLGAR